MKEFIKLINDKVAKSKKSKISIFVVIGVVSVIALSVFGYGGAFIGIIFGVVILAMVVIASYFILKKVDDLPDAIE